VSKLTASNHTRKIISLAWPIVFGQLGHMMSSIADNVMVGQLGSTPLAAAAFANTIFALFILFGIGVAVGLTPLIGSAHGKKDEQQKASLFKHGLLSNTIVGIALTIIMLSLIPLMPYFGQPEEVIETTIPYYFTLSLTIVLTMIFFHFKQFGEGIYITKPTMYITIGANLVNIGLNFIFIYGMLGLPAYGVLGAGIATLLSRILMVLAIFLYFKHTKLKKYFQTFGNKYLSWEKIFFILKNSLPIGFQYIIEVSAFALGAIMIGWLGTISLAAHQIAINLVSVTYLVASGISSATTIRVSNLRGLGKVKEVFFAARSGMKITFVFMIFASVIFLLGNRFLPSLYIDELPVIEIASQLIFIAVLFQLVDGLQNVELGILRGLNDLKIPTYTTMIAYWVIGLPTSYIVGIHFKMGAVGVWIGYLAGLSAAALMLFARYRILKRKMLSSAM
jgi:MATE family multidrug resistance protein